MRIDDLLESISGRLPTGWSVRCEVENGAAWVVAVGPDGKLYGLDSGEDDVERQMEEALVMAQFLSANARKQSVGLPPCPCKNVLRVGDSCLLCGKIKQPKEPLRFASGLEIVD